jgi:hypothetical protein
MTTITGERKPKSKRIVVEIYPDKLERLAASLVLLSSTFLKSLSHSEIQFGLGKGKRLRSLRELRGR